MPQRWCLLLALLVAAGSSAAVASSEQPEYQAGSDVILLTTDSFADVIERQPSPAMVKFIAPDCKTCMDLAPVYKKVATNLKGIATVAAVNCGDVRSVRTCKAFGVYEFPRLLVFKPGTKTNPYTGGAMKDFEQYTGVATPRALASAVTDQLNEQHVTHLNNSKEHEDFVQRDSKLAKVLLFTDKNVTTVLYKGLSWAYPRRLLFAEVQKSEDTQPLIEQYGVAEFPTLLVVKADGSHESYAGALKATPLREFLDAYATKEAQPMNSGAADADRASPERMGEVQLHSLDAGNLTDIVGHADMWLLAFYKAQDDGTCSGELDRFKGLLQDVQGIVNFGSVNAATAGLEAEQLKQYEMDLGQLDMNGCGLQLVLLPYGANKAIKEDYLKWSGSLNDAKALQAWILDQVPDFTSLLSSPEEADRFVAATGNDLPDAAIHSAEDRKSPVGKIFLFSTKKEVPGIYKALAMQFHGKSRLLFGWTAQDDDGPGYAMMQKMNIRKAPAMSILLPLPPKPMGDPTAPNEPVRPPQGEMAIQQYMGPLKFQKMKLWAQAMSSLAGLSYKRHAGATEAPSVNDLDIHNQAQLQDVCYDKPALCLIVLLDGTSDTANQYREVTRKVATALHGQPLTWVAVDVSRQRSFRRAYGFEADQLPGLVALSTRRMRFAQGAAPFSKENAKKLVTSVLTGSAITLPLPELPKLVDGGEPEEGPAAVPGEEEFDLSEIMAEELNAVLSKEGRLQQAEQELAAEEKAKQEKKKTVKKKPNKKKSKKKSTKKKSTASKKDEL